MTGHWWVMTVYGVGAVAFLAYGLVKWHCANAEKRGRLDRGLTDLGLEPGTKSAIPVLALGALFWPFFLVADLFFPNLLNERPGGDA